MSVVINEEYNIFTGNNDYILLMEENSNEICDE